MASLQIISVKNIIIFNTHAVFSNWKSFLYIGDTYLDGDSMVYQTQLMSE